MCYELGENKAGQEVSSGTLRFLLATPGLFAAISHKLALQAQTVLHVCCREAVPDGNYASAMRGFPPVSMLQSRKGKESLDFTCHKMKMSSERNGTKADQIHKKKVREKRKKDVSADKGTGRELHEKQKISTKSKVIFLDSAWAIWYLTRKGFRCVKVILRKGKFYELEKSSVCSGADAFGGRTVPERK